MNIMSNKLLSKMEDPNKLNISMGAVFPDISAWSERQLIQAYHLSMARSYYHIALAYEVPIRTRYDSFIPYNLPDILFDSQHESRTRS